MSFRRYGGINYSSTNNIVHSNYANNNNLNIQNKTGLLNSLQIFDSHIDMNENSILNVDYIYFQDGTCQSTAYTNNCCNVSQPCCSYVDHPIGNNNFLPNPYTTSDYRIKEDIKPIDISYVNIDSLNPVFYYNTKTHKEEFGFLAHEVQKVFPFVVNGEKDAETLQSVNYNSLIALLVKEVQELKTRIKELELESIKHN